MSFDMTLTDKLSIFVEDMRRGGVDCLPPDINASHPFFTVEDGAVRYALGALKGVGEKAMDALVEERERGGSFASLEAFAARIDPRILNRRQLESLAGSGALDELKSDRAAVFAAAETILAHAVQDRDAAFRAADGGAVPIPADDVRGPPAVRIILRGQRHRAGIAAHAEAADRGASGVPDDRLAGLPHSEARGAVEHHIEESRIVGRSRFSDRERDAAIGAVRFGPRVADDIENVETSHDIPSLRTNT